MADLHCFSGLALPNVGQYLLGRFQQLNQQRHAFRLYAGSLRLNGDLEGPLARRGYRCESLLLVQFRFASKPALLTCAS
jgi:hypothetical protein